jgi:hypothetical protein
MLCQFYCESFTSTVELSSLQSHLRTGDFDFVLEHSGLYFWQTSCCIIPKRACICFAANHLGSRMAASLHSKTGADISTSANDIPQRYKLVPVNFSLQTRSC